jgi:type 1 fimbriae regulatory protein FimB
MHHLTQDELKSLLKAISQPRHKLMVKVGFLHGLRVSELINLRKEDIRDGFVRVQRLKGSLKTTQPYVKHPDPELSEAEDLSELYKHLGSNEKLFPMTRFGVYKLIQRAGTRAGIPAHKLHPHVLKHTCAMVGIDTMGIHMVRQYLGHKSISSTGEYLKETDEAASKAFAGALK